MDGTDTNHKPVVFMVFIRVIRGQNSGAIAHYARKLRASSGITLRIQKRGSIHFRQ
jgi:hypothetical protein